MRDSVLEVEPHTDRIKAENERAFNHIRASLPDFLLAHHIERTLQEKSGTPALEREEIAARFQTGPPHGVF